MKNWLAEIGTTCFSGAYFLAQSIPDGGLQGDILRQLGPACVGIVALYLSLKFVERESAHNRKALEQLTTAIENGMLHCPARKNIEEK